MRLLHKFLAATMALMMATALLGATRPVMPLFPMEIRSNGGAISGVLIHTQGNADFPPRPDMQDNEMQEQIQSIVKYLYEMGINTIFYEAVSQFDAMYSSKYYPTSPSLRTQQGFRMQADPLKLFCQEAEKYSMDVYVTVTPYYAGNIQRGNLTEKQKDFLLRNSFETPNGHYLEPNAEVRKLVTDAMAEIAKKYPIKGMVFQNLNDPYLEQRQGYAQNILWQFSDIRAETEKLDREIALGIFYEEAEGGVKRNNLSSALLEKLSVDLVLPRLHNISQEAYEATVQEYYEMTSRYAATLVTISDAGMLNRPTDQGNLSTDPFALNYQAAVNNRIGTGGIVLDSLSDLLDKLNRQNWALSTLFVDGVLPEKEEFPLQQEMYLHIPDTGNIYTTKNSYYITGIAAPNSVFYINEEPFYGIQESGVFGVELPLPQEENEFVFSQNDKRVWVTIYKGSPPVSAKKRINEIVRDSVFPQISQVIPQEENILVSCIAPAGSRVTATLDSMSVQLTQVAEERTGYPVEFRGTMIPQTQYAPDTVVNIGKVSYAMAYNGKINVSKSQGNILIMGKDANLVVQVDDDYAPVYTSLMNTQSYSSVMKLGAKAYVESQQGDFYQLQSGGYIRKSAVKVLEGYHRADNAYTSAAMEVKEEEETITLFGTHPPRITSIYTDNSIIYTFYNTTQLPDIMVGKSKLFKNIMKVKVEDNTYQIHFIFQDGIVPWGYDYRYTGVDFKDTVLTFRYAPQKFDSIIHPLNQISVLLDPGHGGEDTGYSGVVGSSGPTEAELNLAIAEKTKELLESLGATVQLTRYEDKAASTFERMRLGEQMQPHFSLSIHHSGIPEGENGDEQKGVAVFYNQERWSSMAKRLSENVARSTGRDNREGEKSDQLLLWGTDCPTLQLEVGYLSNPQEYGEAIDSFQIYQVACGIVATIMESL